MQMAKGLFAAKAGHRKIKDDEMDVVLMRLIEGETGMPICSNKCMDTFTCQNVADSRTDRLFIVYYQDKRGLDRKGMMRCIQHHCFRGGDWDGEEQLESGDALVLCIREYPHDVPA